MSCHIDHGRYVLKDTGYLPLIGAGGVDYFAVIQEYSAAEIAKFKPGTQVLCSREPGRGRPIVVQRTLTQDTCEGIADRWADPVQFDACLFRVWGDAELALYFGVKGVRNRPIYPDGVKLDNDEDPNGPRSLDRADVIAAALSGSKNGVH